MLIEGEKTVKRLREKDGKKQMIFRKVGEAVKQVKLNAQRRFRPI